MTTPLNPQQDPRDGQDQQDPTRALEEGAPAPAPAPESTTETTETTEATEAAEATEPTAPTDVFEDDTTRRAETGTPSAPEATWAPAAGSDTAPQQPVVAELPRPTGPHAPAIVLGVVLMAIAGLVIAQEVGSLRVDWGDVGPLGIVAAGAMLVLFGLLGLLTSRRNQA